MMSEALRSVNIRVRVPEGTMFVTVVEDISGRPIQLLINIGKAGSSLAAWTYAVGRMCTVMFENGFGVNDLIDEFATISSDKAVPQEDGEEAIHSGPAGIAVALVKYRAAKFKEFKEIIGAGNKDG